MRYIYIYMQELFKTEGHHSDGHKTNLFRSYVPTEAKNTATGLAMQSKERVYTVDRDASSHMMGLLSLNHKE